MNQDEIILTVDGKEIPLNGYVRKVFISVIRSLAATLHGVSEDDDISITVKRG